MPNSRPHNETDTHEVLNQPPTRGDLDLWDGDPALRDHAHAADDAHLAAYGRKIGRAAMREAGMEANRHPPRRSCSIPAAGGWTRCHTIRPITC